MGILLIGIFATSSDIETLTEEIIKMSRFSHPNVMKLLGVCVAPAGGSFVGPSIVMHFMAKGNLLDYLRKEADNLFATREEQVNKRQYIKCTYRLHHEGEVST